MKKTYVTDKYSTDVKVYDVVRETEKQIVYMTPSWNKGGPDKETRSHKISEYYFHHASMKDALQYLLDRENDAADRHEQSARKHRQAAADLLKRQLEEASK